MKILTLYFSLITSISIAQNTVSFDSSRIIPVGMPFLQINSDAISSGMGDTGVATPPNIFSQRSNPSKYSFAKYRSEIGINYTPYLSEVVNDMFLGSIYFYKKGKRNNAWGLSFNYFKMGVVDYTLQQGNTIIPMGSDTPNELTIDFSYSLILSEYFSLSVLGRWLHSNLKLRSDNNSSSANSISTDISGYYQSPLHMFEDFDGRWILGFNISNIGPKLSYDKRTHEYFIPTTLKIGVGYEISFISSQKFIFSLQLNKLLVPTPPIYGYLDENNNNVLDKDERKTIVKGKDNKVFFLQGIFQSFSDAPGGINEELQEINGSVGVLYDYNNIFQLRAGYFYEHPLKGGREYLTMGVGVNYKNIDINTSYLFSTSKFYNPLEKSFRISISTILKK